MVSTDAHYCRNIRLIVPGEPDASALIMLLEDTCPDGLRMPPAALYPEEIAIVRSWIAAGAEL